MRKIVLFFTLLAALMGAFYFSAVAAEAKGGTPTGTITNPVRIYPACAEEDGSGGVRPCIWDGKVRGNRTGSSYIVKSDYTTNPLYDTTCTATRTTNCRLVTDASQHYTEWVRGDGSHVGCYAPGYGPAIYQARPGQSPIILHPRNTAPVGPVLHQQLGRG